MTILKQEYLHSVIGILALLLGSCAPQNPSRKSSRIKAANTDITAALGAEANGKAMVYAAAPTTYVSMEYCILDQNSLCVGKPVSMVADRTTADRKIFRIADPTALQKSTWKLTAISSNGTNIQQNIQMKLAGDQPSIPQTGGLNWKVLLMASDQGDEGAWINAFDNARVKLKQIFSSKGVLAGNFRELSLHQDHQSQTVKPTSAANFLESMKSFGTPATNDACIVHMTSHGSPDGFNIGWNRLSPGQLDQALLAGCGDRPTVVLVSACFSGLYVLDSSKLKKPNRIILTAARSDLTSFGCSSEAEYTYWDSCLVETLPTATKWKELAKNVVSCIERKESGGEASFPQTFIGSDVADLDLPK